MLQLLLYLGIIFLAFGFISIIQLGRIYTKYSDMYPWFGGEQPWKTGFYLFFFGGGISSIYVLFKWDIFSLSLSVVDSIVVFVILSVSVTLPYVLFDRYKVYVVLRAEQ